MTTGPVPRGGGDSGSAERRAERNEPFDVVEPVPQVEFTRVGVLIYFYP